MNDYNWYLLTEKKPPSEGWYLFKRTKRDAPSVRVFLDRVGFRYVETDSRWCKIPRDNVLDGE